jgi:hypothetical protein
LADFDLVLHLDPDFAQAHWNRAVVLLLLGDFERGWPEYEWRWTQPWKKSSVGTSPLSPSERGAGARGGAEYSQPLWDGSDVAGRTILLYAEQGMGDTMHFIRYAPLVKQRGGRVVVECQPPLLPLLATAGGIDALVGRGSPLPVFDFQAPLLGLSGIFRTDFTNIPTAIPYLEARSELAEQWRNTLRSSSSAFRIGIAWQGNPGFLDDWERSMPLAQFAPLAQVPGVQLISLQKGPGTEQLQVPSNAQFPLSTFALDESAGAFMDTAAIMKSLDLVICSDSAIPHLAGALGVPVWMALPFVPDWRWLLQREDSPWYPTMRLFRQSREGDWEDVFLRIAAELTKLLKALTPDP